MFHEVPIAVNILPGSNKKVMELLRFGNGKTIEGHRIRVLVFPNDKGVHLLSLFRNVEMLDLLIIGIVSPFNQAVCL